MSPAEICTLANRLAAFEGVSHWAISQRIYGRGDVFQRLNDGRNAYHSTLERAERWFSANWPEDLAWPDGIDRPSTPKCTEQDARQAVA